MSGPSHVLFIGGRGHELPKAQRLGLRYSMIQIPERVDEQQAAGARHYAVLDYTRLDRILPVVRAWHAADPFDAVVSFTEYGLEPASRCAIELGLPGDNLTAVLRTRDKTRTRELLNRRGLSTVRHRICEQPSDAREFMAELAGVPVVLKPPAGGLSEGVFLVETEAQLAERWSWTCRFADGPLLVEEFLTGPEYSVESISRDGKHEVAVVTEKLTTTTPGFIELGHQQPARLTPADRAGIDELTHAFLGLIEQRTGPVHTELRLTPSGPRLIEAQTRVGGDQIWELCERVSGIDMIAETLAHLLDLPVPARTPVAPAAAIRFFCYENALVRGVRGRAEAQRAPGVVRLQCTLRPGQRLGPLSSSNSRQGYVICDGTDTEDAVRNAETARDLVRVDREPLG
ncbi:ATP-grasp domain-containing protein [Kitasatospora acidiphila]|nr:ATP-grasp domain-containing protein [Kitasatospora acidiphila]